MLILLFSYETWESVYSKNLTCFVFTLGSDVLNCSACNVRDLESIPIAFIYTFCLLERCLLET